MSKKKLICVKVPKKWAAYVGCTLRQLRAWADQTHTIILVSQHRCLFHQTNQTDFIIQRCESRRASVIIWIIHNMKQPQTLGTPLLPVITGCLATAESVLCSNSSIAEETQTRPFCIVSIYTEHDLNRHQKSRNTFASLSESALHISSSQTQTISIELCVEYRFWPLNNELRP